MTHLPLSPVSATLKPCPFCGSAPIMDVHHENEDGTGIIEFVVVRCSSCRTSKERPSPSAAAQAWNRRFGCAQRQQEPVAYRWRQPGNKHWIYDPTPEWIEDHKLEIELEALFTVADTSTDREASK